MYLLENLPIWLNIIYKLCGIVQFATNDRKKTKKILRLLPLLWPIPLYCYFLHVSLDYVLNWCLIDYSEFTITLRYSDTVAMDACIGCMINSMITFYRRRKRIHNLLKKIQTHDSNDNLASDVRYTQIAEMLLLILILNISMIPFQIFSVDMFILSFIPTTVNSFDHLFLAQILFRLKRNFETINNQMCRNINSVDLTAIFPLTKKHKLLKLIEEETVFNINQIQKLSHKHYNLYCLVMEVNEIFGITILGVLLMWFTNVIDNIYYILLLGSTYDTNLFFVFVSLIMFLTYYVLWLFIIVYNFSLLQNEVSPLSPGGVYTTHFVCLVKIKSTRYESDKNAIFRDFERDRHYIPS